MVMMMTSAPSISTFSAKQAAQRAGIAYHLVDSWARGDTPIVRPSVPSAGQGTRREYSFRDVVALRVASQLRSVGVCSLVIRAAVAAVQNEVTGIDRPAADPGEAWVIVDARRGDAVAVRTCAELKRVATTADPVAIVIDVGDIARHLGIRTNRRFRLPKPSKPRA